MWHRDPSAVVDHPLRTSSPGYLITGLTVLAAVNLLVVLITGGYEFYIGPWAFQAHHIWNPVLLCLGFTIVKVWLRGGRRGIPPTVRLRSPLLPFLSFAFIYSLTKRSNEPGDAIPARYLRRTILRELNLDLDEFALLYETEIPYVLKRSGTHIVSAYPPWAPPLALPVYILTVLGGAARQSHLLPQLATLAATLIIALSAIVLFLALKSGIVPLPTSLDAPRRLSAAGRWMQDRPRHLVSTSSA